MNLNSMKLTDIRGKEIIFWLAVLGAGGSGVSHYFEKSNPQDVIETKIAVIETKIEMIEKSLDRIEKKLE